MTSEVAPTAPQGSPDEVAQSRSAQLLALFREHHQRLVSVLTARIGSRSEAEDLAQAAYERLLVTPREGTASFLAAYLYRTAQNLLRDGLRRRVRTEREQLLDAAQGSSGLAPSAEAEYAAHQREELLKQALSQLPPAVRVAFLLKVYSGLSYPDIVAEMARRNVLLDRRTIIRYVQRAAAHCTRFIAATESAQGDARDQR